MLTVFNYIPTSLLPQWFADRARAGMVPENCAIDEDADATCPLQNCSGDHLFRNALLFPGPHRAIHYVKSGVCDVLGHVQVCFGWFQVIERLSGHLGRREGFIASCLQNSVWATFVEVFRNFSCSSYVKRWRV